MDPILTRVRVGKQSRKSSAITTQLVDPMDSLWQEAQSKITNCPIAEVRCIELEIAERTLILRGQVSSFYLKQMAQETVRSREGIETIQNLIEVV